MATAVGTDIMPREPASLPALRAPPTGAWPTPWSRSCPTTPAASTPLSGASSPAGVAPRRASHRGPLPGRQGQRRRQYRHPAPRHVRHLENPRMGKAGIPLPGPGRARLSEGMGRRLAKPQRQAGALTADVLVVIRLTAVQRRLRGRGIETPEQAAQRGKFDVALVAVLSDAGVRRSEASSLAWGDVQRWDDGSGRITVNRSKTDVEAAGAVVAITPVAMRALDAIRPAGVGGEVKVFGLSESQIGRRVKGIAKAAGLTDWEFFSGHSGGWVWRGVGPPTRWLETGRRMAQNGARPPAPPTRSSGRAAGNRAAAWSAATRGANRPDQR